MTDDNTIEKMASLDELSRDRSNAILVEKLTRTAGPTLTNHWTGKGYSHNAVTVFRLEGSKYEYRLVVEQDHSVSALRYNPERLNDTPRKLSDHFAKLLYMKVWPDVGI